MDTLLTHAKVAMQPGKSATKLSTQLQDRMKEVAGHPNDLSKKKQMMQTLGLQYAPRIEALLQRADPRKRPLLDFALPGDLVRCKNELERDYKQYLQESAPPRGFEPKDKLTDTIARVSKDWVADSSLSPGVYSSQGYHITPSQGYAGSVHIQSHEEQQAIDDAVAGTRTAPSPTRTQPRSSHSDPQTREPSYAHQSERPTQTLGGLGLRPRSGNRDQSVADEGRSGNSSGNASLRSYSRQHSSADERPFSSEGDPAYEHSRRQSTTSTSESMQRSLRSSGEHGFNDGSSVRSGSRESRLGTEEGLGAISRFSKDSQDFSRYLDRMSLEQGGQAYPPQSQWHQSPVGSLPGSQARRPPAHYPEGVPLTQGYAQPSYNPGIPPQAPGYAQPSYGQSGTLQTAGYGQPTYGHALPPTHMPATYQHPQQMGGWPGMGTPGHVAPGTQPYARYDASGSSHYPPGAGSSSDKGKYDYPYGGR